MCSVQNDLFLLSSDPVKDSALLRFMTVLDNEYKEQEFMSQLLKKEKIEDIAIATEESIPLSPEMAKYLGVEGETPIRIVKRGNRFEIIPNIHSLARVYIEVTAECNLACQTCVRNTWSEPIGSMKTDVFNSLIEQLQEFKNLQSVMFGGFGEPTCHKDILEMIGQVKSLGVQAEMTTNGTLLDKDMLIGLMKNKLDTLWVSFDGTSEESFDSIRAGASFKELVKNLKLLKEMNKVSTHKIKVGIVFVVMKKNIEQLINLRKLAREVGAVMALVSNVIPYSYDMVEQMLCTLSVEKNSQSADARTFSINLPSIDIFALSKQPLFELLRGDYNISIMNNQLNNVSNYCRFVKERCTFIKWDGSVSPCMGLLHSYKTYFNAITVEREVTAYSLGNIKNNSLKEIWDSQEYYKFREKVDKFEFSPCHVCGPCDLAKKNEEDCFGNVFPTCGGCLWAQGVIQCP